jgi:anti-sigma factor RsiW
VDCPRAEELLDAYLDGELDLVRSLEVERHLSDCKACTASLADLRALQTAVQTAPLRYAPSEDLEYRVRQAFRRASRPRFRGVTMLVASCAAILLAVLASWLVVTSGWLGTGFDPQGREVAEAHVRSLLAAHRTDVGSSDRHTVKPWFVGKLDYAPPVPDLTAGGFKLIGGRLDYVEDRPVSCLVYERRQHVINLFVWPSPSATEVDLTHLEKKGYNLYHWEHGGMTWWAVSDLNANELRSFACLVREQVAYAQ